MYRFLTLTVLTLIVLPAMVRAQETTELTLPAQSDIRIIVDISGSMKENDPGNLRQPAVRLLARMLPEGTSAGLWTFGEYVNMLVPHRDVTDEWRKTAIERSNQINSVALRTNLGKAIEVASDGYYTGGVLDHTHFILLTDGKVDISDDPERNRQEEQRILQSTLADLVAQGATLHPVALSSQADAEFLEQLASESGGRFQIAESADALNRAFLEALNTAVPQEQIPIEGNAFLVDSGVKEFTALIFWGDKETRSTRELELVRPDGKTLGMTSLPDNARWARETGYDLVTLSEPLSGEWRIKGELGSGSRVTVVSDLRMVVSQVPPSFSESSPFDVRVAFFEKADKIINPDFLQVLDVSLTITSEDGRSGTKELSGEQPPENGVYSDRIGRLPAVGVYRIDVVADGQTFGRKFSATARYTAPEGAVSGEPAIQEGTDPDEGELPQVSAEPEQIESVEEQKPVASEDSETAPLPAIDSPIDVSQAEEPQVAPPAATEPSALKEEEVSQLPFPMWMLGAGGGGLAVLLLAWLAVKKRNNRAMAQAEAAAERETIADLEEQLEPEPEDIPEVTDETPPEDDMADLEKVFEEPGDEIPVADAIVEPEEGPEDDEAIPELDEVADDSASEDDEEEFGLDDFDLSEFDDLPDFEEDDSGLPNEAAEKKRDDKEQKK
ncbi:hypothetical protein BKP64_04755 [Marinobacter salinus]|uniref:VWFA domain-containing protein n=1 Tax=Marinobacter salinus TaxID=1874317 RepID=A0A1D9GIQ8_9GAMM|nr:vWA domain-containing protein [Marinobacter salinus]AOY87536.1 hypothetical protein BKP64_04755 [Marinobacter salinus]